MDNMELARLPESGRLDMKKLGDMWKTLAQPQREVTSILTAHSKILVLYMYDIIRDVYVHVHVHCVDEQYGNL